MKVVINNPNCYFSDIGCGEVFETNGDIYMRTESVRSMETGDDLNAVDLEDGSLLCFDDAIGVRKVKGIFKEFGAKE